MTDIFKPNERLQNDEFHHLLRYMQAIHQAFWHPDHFTYDRDVRDFTINLTPFERQVITRCMLAIGVVENKVKTFWARVDMRCPISEVADVAHTFAGNEVIHKVTYKMLLDYLGLDKEFETIFEVPCMKGRAEYLSKYLKGLTTTQENKVSDKEFTKSLILFTALVENASLFSQFLLISSFNKYQNRLANFATVVSATAREENLHGQFGAELIRIIREQHPEWFDDAMEAKVRRNIIKAYEAECGVLEWIFEGGELEFMPKVAVREYLKKRFNLSLNQLGYEDEFELDEDLLECTNYFDTSVKCSVSFDFFNEKSVDYAKTNLVTEDDWEGAW